jgi:1-phosphofructokinase family hexose kinase
MFHTLTLNPVLDRTFIVPSIEFNEILRPTQINTDLGGKGFNVSRSLKKLGMDNIAHGFLGGAVGEKFKQGLADLEIALDPVSIAGETRTNTVVIEQETGKYIKVNEPGPEIQEAELAAMTARVKSLALPGDIWILSGSLPPGVPMDYYNQLIHLLHQPQVKVYFDASGEPLSQGIRAAPFLVKPNLEEAAQVFGRPIKTPVEQAAVIQFFLDQGIEVVALSTGPDGLWLASHETWVHAIPPDILLHNPVGIGDALLAGLAQAFYQGMPFDQAARWGTACGTTAAMAFGVNFGTREEVRTIFDQVRVETIRP